MKTFLILWQETVNYNNSVEIEANSKEEALKKWKNNEYGEYHREEINNSFDKNSVEIREEK